MFVSYTKEEILLNIASKNQQLDHGYTFGQPNNINVGRYKLTECTISQIDINSQSVIRSCIDLIVDGRHKGYTCKIFLNNKFNVDFLLYELHNAKKAGFFKTEFKYVSNNKCNFCASVLPNSNFESDKKTIFIIDDQKIFYLAENVKAIFIEDTYVLIKIF